MSYKGTVKNGVVVLPPETKLPEGAEVEVTPLEARADDSLFLQAILKLAKPATGPRTSLSTTPITPKAIRRRCNGG